MFVPFIFTLGSISSHDHIIQFYNYLDMAVRYHWPIIAQERYFAGLDEMAKIGFDNDWFLSVGKHFGVPTPTQESIDNVHQYKIPQAFEDTFVSNFPSWMDAWVDLLINNHPPFEEMLLGFFHEIEKQYNEKIEGILCFFVPASLRAAADKMGIPILSQEYAAFRPPFYKKAMFMVDKVNIYSKGELQERYQRFKKEAGEVPMLPRKELLRLFAKEEWQKDLYLMEQTPEYKLGYAASFRHEARYQYSRMDNYEVLTRARRRWKKEEILVRDAPWFPSGLGTDNSPTSFHFVCKCEGIAAIQSNVLFEAMLYGRKAYGYGDHPFSFMENKGVEDESMDIAPLDFVNFVIFAYFLPAEWATNAEHLRFLLSNPSEKEIYIKSFEYHTKHLSPNELTVYYTGNFIDKVEPDCKEVLLCYEQQAANHEALIAQQKQQTAALEETINQQELQNVTLQEAVSQQEQQIATIEIERVFEKEQIGNLTGKLILQEANAVALLAWTNRIKRSLPYRAARKVKKLIKKTK